MTGQEKTPLTCAVRYGYMAYVGEFRYAPGVISSCGGKVVIQTNRGIEIGEQISLTCSGCGNSIDHQQMLDYVKTSGAQELCQPRAGRILRSATPEDVQEDTHIRLDTKAKLQRARELARSHNLDMKVVACEHLFGGERIIFHFMAENRVDFRELVRELAHDYHTRIEMHQVGARDEARLVADYEICGRECCCKSFLKKLRPVTMRMAKLQKATLDPSKVSGRCGRLRCCLRYEHEGYDELNRNLPRVGTRVQTDKGIGTIRGRQVLTQLLTIVYDESEYEETVGIEALLARNLPRRPVPAAPAQDASEHPGSAPEGRHRGRRQPPKAAPRRSAQSGAGPRPQREEKKASAEPPAGPASQQAAAGGSEQSRGPGTDGAKRKRRRGRRGRHKRQTNQDGGGSSDQKGSGARPPADRTKHPRPKRPKGPDNKKQQGGDN
ncbi:MAG: regulatory iron-sulfur-containing complex subunit RicT [Planctomycetota bacterium]